jgi:hypothetical protein
MKKGKFDWQRQHRFDVDWAKRLLMTAGSVSPMFVIVAEAGSTVFAVPDWSDAVREPVYMLIALQAAAANAFGISFMSEAWLRTIAGRSGESRDEVERRANQVRPSEAEDRIEVISIQCIYRDGAGDKQSLLTHLEIERDYTTGEPTSTKLLSFGEGLIVDTRIAECLPSEVLSPQKCAIAAELSKRVAKGLGIEMTELRAP